MLIGKVCLCGKYYNCDGKDSVCPYCGKDKTKSEGFAVKVFDGSIYKPTFGKTFKTSKELKTYCRENKMVEVGNDKSMVR
jgi:hypothetical protein